jgi:hypothetical protein
MATLAVRKPAEGCREEVITDPEMIEGRSSSGFQRMPVGMPTERHESTCSMREPIDRDSLDKLGALKRHQWLLAVSGEVLASRDYPSSPTNEWTAIYYEKIHYSDKFSHCAR